MLFWAASNTSAMVLSSTFFLSFWSLVHPEVPFVPMVVFTFSTTQGLVMLSTTSMSQHRTTPTQLNPFTDQTSLNLATCHIQISSRRLLHKLIKHKRKDTLFSRKKQNKKTTIWNYKKQQQKNTHPWKSHQTQLSHGRTRRATSKPVLSMNMHRKTHKKPNILWSEQKRNVIAWRHTIHFISLYSPTQSVTIVKFHFTFRHNFILVRPDYLSHTKMKSRPNVLKTEIKFCLHAFHTKEKSPVHTRRKNKLKV